MALSDAEVEAIHFKEFGYVATGLGHFARAIEAEARRDALEQAGNPNYRVDTIAPNAPSVYLTNFDDTGISNNDLVTRAEEAIELDTRQRMANATVDSVNARLSTLTTRERQVMEQVLLGKFNKVIADELNISMRTVEVHRANLFDKMQVKTAVELANLLKPNR